MSNRDVGVVAQTTSGRLPGEVATADGSMQPQRLPLRSDRHYYDARPKRPFDEPGSTRSDSRLKREGQKNSAGLEVPSHPSSPTSKQSVKQTGKRPSGRDRAQAQRGVATKTLSRHAVHADTAIQVRASGHSKMPGSNARQSPTQCGTLGSESSKVMSMPQPAGPAALLSQEHKAISGLRRPQANPLATGKAKSSTHYVANATLSAAPQHGVCLRTTTSSVHKRARASMEFCSPFAQPKSAYPSGYSKDSRCAPSRPQAKWRSPPKNNHLAKRPPKVSRAGTPSHDACRETHKPSEHCYQRTAPSLLPGGHQRPGRPGRQYRAIAESERQNVATAVASSGYRMPSKMQTVNGYKVASKSYASVPSRECSPDAAPSLRRTIRDNKHCAPHNNEREHQRGPCRQASSREDTSASLTNQPTATARQFKRGPQPDFSPSSNSLPADEVEHGPGNSDNDSRAEMARARGPHSKRVRLESRQRQLEGMETRRACQHGSTAPQAL